MIESFSENVFRSDMTLSDKAKTAITLLKMLDNDKNKVAKNLGVHISTLERYLEHESLPKKLQKLIREKKMNFYTAKTIYKKTKHDEIQRNKIIESYIKKEKKDKNNFYVALKESKASDKLEDIEKNSKEIANSQKYILRSPTAQNKFIQKIAKDKNISPEMVLQNFIAVGIEEFKHGRMRI